MAHRPGIFRFGGDDQPYSWPEFDGNGDPYQLFARGVGRVDGWGLVFYSARHANCAGAGGVYVRYGATPQAEWLLYGVKPVVIAVIGQALWNLGQKTIKTWGSALVAGVVIGLYFLGVNEIARLFAGGLVVMGAKNFQQLRGRALGLFLLPVGAAGLLAQGTLPFSLPLFFFIFLKIGAVLYGSGYVLLAFLRADFVLRFG